MDLLTLWPVLSALLKLDLASLKSDRGLKGYQALSKAVAEVGEGAIKSLGSKDDAIKFALVKMVGEQKALREFLQHESLPDLADELSERAKAIAEGLLSELNAG